MSSKQKGNTYERKTAKVLGDWWGYEFYRTPSSGGLHGWSSDLNVAGDIVTSPESEFPFVVECKNRESGGWTLESIVLDKHDIKNWWEQCVQDARRVNKTPVLVFTRNRAEDFVMMPYMETVYNLLEANDKPAMRTYVEYTDDLTKQKERFDVLITSVTGFTSFTPDFWKENSMKDWDTVTRLTKDIEAPVEDIDDIVGKLKNN